MFFKFAQNNYICIAVPVAPLPDISAGDESGFFSFMYVHPSWVDGFYKYKISNSKYMTKI